MTSLTCTIEPDELLGLSALAELDRAAAGGGTDTCTGTGTGTEPAPTPTWYEARRR